VPGGPNPPNGAVLIDSCTVFEIFDSNYSGSALVNAFASPFITVDVTLAALASSALIAFVTDSLKTFPVERSIAA
jgi:hypothetical protein